MALMLGVVGCGQSTQSTNSTQNNIPSDSLVLAYYGAYASLLLPEGWTVEQDTIEADDVYHIADSLGVTTGVVEFYPPEHSFKIRIAKSPLRCIMPNTTVYEWTEMAQFSASGDSNLIHISDITDSLSVDGHDACAYGMEFDVNGDTIYQDQFVVTKGNYGLYYINGIYHAGDKEAQRLIYKILSTIKLK